MVHSVKIIENIDNDLKKYGLEIETESEVLTFQNLTAQKSSIVDLAERIEGKDLISDHIKDIVKDYILDNAYTLIAANNI